MGANMKIHDVILTPLKIIENDKGDIYHSIKNIDKGFKGFGEAYFSTIKQNVIKAWKKHLIMTLNLTVPVGKVKFVLFDDRKDSPSYGHVEEMILSTENYLRLTVPPNIWIGFQGINSGLNLILNIADIVHNPDEQINIELNKIDIPYKWTNLL